MTANATELLALRLEPTATAKSPEVVPDAIVKVIEDSFQELIVCEVPLMSTRLLPCVVPKPLPLTTTWLPIEPVVADIPVIMGADDKLEVMATLSNVAVARPGLTSAVTASPMQTDEAIPIVWVLPICAQTIPSYDEKAVKLFPLLTSFTQ